MLFYILGQEKAMSELIIVPDYHTKKYFLDCGYKNNIFISGHLIMKLRKSNIPTKKSKLKLPFRVKKIRKSFYLLMNLKYQI